MTTESKDGWPFIWAFPGSITNSGRSHMPQPVPLFTAQPERIVFNGVPVALMHQGPRRRRERAPAPRRGRGRTRCARPEPSCRRLWQESPGPWHAHQDTAPR